MTLPRALAPFMAFAQACRAHGFAVAPEQTQAFIAATGLLGPRGMADLRRAARATFAPPPERFAEFDALFDLVFLGRTVAAPAPGAPEDMPRAFDAGPEGTAPDIGEDAPSGADAAETERLFARDFAAGDEAALLRAFRRAAPAALPRRRSRRLVTGPGRIADPRRTLREMARRDGEIARLPRRRRLQRQRRVLLLIDVSGSMKAGTEGALRVAHALVRAAERVEVFTLGTRLTRVTRALRHPDPDRALTRVAALVADWDGGTRLGDTLAVFLSAPRFAGFARGALVVVLSDGLERGGPEALAGSMARMRGLAWAVLWLTPLQAADYRPETAALRAILPFIDRLGDASQPARVCAELLGFAKGARP